MYNKFISCNFEPLAKILLNLQGKSKGFTMMEIEMQIDLRLMLNLLFSFHKEFQLQCKPILHSNRLPFLLVASSTFQKLIFPKIFQIRIPKS